MSSNSRDSSSPSLSDRTSPFDDALSRPTPSPAPSNDGRTPVGKTFIKRPLNPYLCWVMTKREEVIRNNPQLKMNDVNVALGNLWRQMSDAERKPFFEQSAKSREAHKLMMEANPHLVFKPVKVKKPVETAQAPATPAAGGRPVPMLVNPSQTNGGGPMRTPASNWRPTANGGSQTLGQALGVRPQTNGQRPAPYQQPATPAAPQITPQERMQQMMEKYYLSLCQPAFPQPGDAPNSRYNANFYWDQCQQLANQL